RNNLDLRAATARILEARAQRGVVAADWWPTVNVDGSYTRRRRTDTSSGTVGGATTPGGTTTGGTTGGAISLTNKRESSLWNAGFDATWELDVFGAVSRNVEASNADIQAAVEDRRDVLVTLLAEV